MFAMTKKRKKSNKRPLIIVCTSVGLIAAGASIFIYAMKRRD
jgi:hypothetical protein